MPSSPLISVVLPAYNAERYVGLAIRSILAQTEPDFELIVLNDGSTDGTLAAIRQAVGGDARGRIVDRGNVGIVRTLNEGIEMARGALIARMDADDIARPERFARQRAHLEAHPACVALGSRVLLIDPEGLPLMEMIDERTHAEIDAANLAYTSSFICHPSVMMRRQAVLDVGGYRPEYESAEDLDLFLRLAEVGEVANLPEVLLDYRQHFNSIGYAKAEKQWRTADAAAHAARQRRGLPQPAQPRVFNAGPPRRPVDEYRKWAWWALRGGHPGTARKYVLRSIRSEPFQTLKAENLRLLACALRGY